MPARPEGSLRIAMTETCNVFRDMPQSSEALRDLAPRLDEIREANNAHHEALARTAAADGAQIIGFGELFNGPYFATVEDEMWLDFAEDAADGPTVRRFRALAKALSVVIIAPIYEHDRAVGRRYNTAVVIDAGGEVLGKYRKTHIPQGRNEREQFVERYYYGPADAEGPEALFPVFETRFARVGVAICYDRHFEGVMRTLSAHGAQVVFSPAVTFGAKSEYFWEREFEVDAMRHRVFIAGSNRCGPEPPFGLSYFGRSYVAGPDGRVADHRSRLNLVIADLDLSALGEGDSSGWNLPRDRRPKDYVP